MILITCASGQVGCAVIRALSKSGIETKAFIHRTSSMEKVKEAGATEVFVGEISMIDKEKIKWTRWMSQGRKGLLGGSYVLSYFFYDIFFNHYYFCSILQKT